MSEMSVAQWSALVAVGAPVGRCPIDSGPMLGEDPYDVRGRLYLDSRCEVCGHESSRPGGRALPAQVVVPFRRRPVQRVDREPDYAERAAGGR